MSALFRRCGCRDEDGRQYGVLPEKPTEKQRARACPKMLADPKHGRWSFRISAKRDPMTGKRRQVNGRSYDTKREAQRERNKAAAKIDTGTYVVPSRQTFAEYLPTWLDRHTVSGRGLRPSTVENYRRYINHDIAPSPLGAMRLGDIRRHHINAYIAQLSADGRGAVTVHRIVAVIQGALKAATIEQAIEDNPATMLVQPTVKAHRFEPWQPEQVGAFLDVAAAHRLGVFFEVAVFTGLRRAELVGLVWSDVDLQAGQLRVRESKTEAGVRVVDLDDRSTGALMAWRLAQEAEAEAWGPAWTDTGAVFTYEDGRPLKLQYVTRLFQKLRKQAGLPKMTLHGLRHMHASLMLASGVPLGVVSKRLGHSSVAITSDTYSHLVGSASRDAANRAASLVPARGGDAHTTHTHAGQGSEEATSEILGNGL